MTATEVRDKIFDIENQLHQLSEIFAGDIEYNGIDIRYLSNKFISLENTVNHIKGQIKHQMKK